MPIYKEHFDTSKVRIKRNVLRSYRWFSGRHLPGMPEALGSTEKEKEKKAVAMAHTYSPSHSGGRDLEDIFWKKFVRLHLKKLKKGKKKSWV
jgi:hypothetical protein